MVYAAQPREGTETQNGKKGLKLQEIQVYAAQPREGTETYAIFGFVQDVIAERFMQLNPARGRKPYCVLVHLAVPRQ